MIGVLPDDHIVETHHQLCLALGGDETSFTGDLLRLIAKADMTNRARLRAAFPRAVAYWTVWQDRAPLLASRLAAYADVLIASWGYRPDETRTTP